MVKPMEEINNKINNIYTNMSFENNALVFGTSDSYFDN